MLDLYQVLKEKRLDDTIESQHKECFFKFEEVFGGVVYIGSGDVSYITGMSSIRLRNHDGSIRVLIDVQYVTKLKKNLISLGP